VRHAPRQAATALAVAVLAAGCGQTAERRAAPPPSSATSPAATPALVRGRGPRLAFATGHAVSVRAADGTVTRVGPLAKDGIPGTLAWTRDGTALTWLEYAPDHSARVVAYRLPDGTTVASDPRPDDPSDYLQGVADLPPLTGVAGTRLVSFAVAGGRLAATEVPLGVRIPTDGYASAQAALPGRLLVGLAGGPGAAGGIGDEYVVAPDGKATLAFRAPADENRGISSVAATRSGDRVAYVIGASGGACTTAESMELRRAEGWRKEPVPLLPPAPTGAYWQVVTTAYGEDGRLFAVLDAVTEKCASPTGPILYELVGRSFTKRRSGIVWGASAAAGTLATIAASAPLANGVPQPGPGVLEVTKAGGRPVRVAGGVTEAAWSPA
jgi:hypothetical protein